MVDMQVKDWGPSHILTTVEQPLSQGHRSGAPGNEEEEGRIEGLVQHLKLGVDVAQHGDDLHLLRDGAQHVRGVRATQQRLLQRCVHRARARPKGRVLKLGHQVPAAGQCADSASFITVWEALGTCSRGMRGICKFPYHQVPAAGAQAKPLSCFAM